MLAELILRGAKIVVINGTKSYHLSDKILNSGKNILHEVRRQENKGLLPREKLRNLTQFKPKFHFYNPLKKSEN